MNEREICERIVKDGSCRAIKCHDDGCPFRTGYGGCMESMSFRKATDWLADNAEPEFQRGEIILVWDIYNPEPRIFLRKQNDQFICVSGDDMNIAKEKFLTNEYMEYTWHHAKKLNGEIVRDELNDEQIRQRFGLPECPIKSEMVTLIEKENSVFRFSKNYISVVLTIDYDKCNYSLKNNKYDGFVFSNTDRYNQNITVIELMLEATRYAKAELEAKNV